MATVVVAKLQRGSLACNDDIVSFCTCVGTIFLGPGCLFELPEHTLCGENESHHLGSQTDSVLSASSPAQQPSEVMGYLFKTLGNCHIDVKH